MADTDYLLLPSLSHYFLSTPLGANRSEAFLDTTATLQNGTYRDLLLKNVDHVINMSKPFAANTSCQNLVHIRDTLVGNWRDSGVGLGYGKIPFDINSKRSRVRIDLRSLMMYSRLCPFGITSDC